VRLAHYKCISCGAEFKLPAQGISCFKCHSPWVKWLNYSEDWIEEEIEEKVDDLPQSDLDIEPSDEG